MSETVLTKEKLEMLSYFIDTVTMSRAQRDTIARAILEGILRGSIDVDHIFAIRPIMPDSNVNSFLQTMVKNGGGEFQASVLYCRYAEWCAACRIRSISIVRFGSVLQELGVRKTKKADGNYYTIELDYSDTPMLQEGEADCHAAE